jgi:hypothetical protein
MHHCVFKLETWYGLMPCGDDGTVFDRARKGWLCRRHARERLCEFCQAERAWARVCYRYRGITHDAWLCNMCVGYRAPERRLG